MEEPESKQSIVETLSRDWKRHPVLRVGSAYCVTAWLILQVAETVLPNYDVPDWVMPSLINVLLALFPVVLIAARFTRVSSLIPAESDVICEQETEREPDPLEQAGEILRLESPELDIPISISERMRVTTAACSLTGIRAGRDDRELLLGIIPAIDEQVKAIVERYEGIRLPSGRNAIVIAFGYPNLHEDDVRRAAKACQEILALLSNQHSDDPDASILARAGLYTGTIIVNDDDSQEDELALLGDNTTVAEWLQAFAPEGGIALSAGSANMLSAYFMLEEIGRHSHPRLGQDVPVCSLGPELSRQWQQVMVEQADLFGRQNEYRLLLDHWQTVLDGESQFLLLVGEAGIGKSSLIYRVVRELLSGEPLRLIILNCESYNANSPFRPVISYLEQQVYDGDLGLPHETRLEKLRNYLDELGADAAMAVPLLASLLSIETMEPDLQIDESSKMIREKTLNLIVDLLQAQAKIQPLLLVVEDLHWADPSTTDLIERLLSDTPEHRIYGMFSARPDFQSPWSNLSHVFAIHLNKLPDRVAEELVREKFGDHAVPEWLIRHIVVECGGIPLFLEELVRALQGSTESLVDADPETLKIPPNLQASMDARVAKLGRGKPLLQLCSVIGQQFSYELLRKVVRGSDDQTLSNVLANLVREGLLYQKGIIPDADFKFKHRLLMEAVYQSLLVKTRAELHGTIAETIEVFFPDLCVTAPVRMAQHFSLSGDPEKAIDYRIKAAHRAQRSFANDESLVQIQRGLDLLTQVKDGSTRNRLEMALQNLRGMVLLSSRGYTNPDVRVAFERAIEISGKVDNSPELFTMIVGLWMYYLIKAEYSKSMDIGRRLLVMAGETNDFPEFLQANYCIGYSRYYTGEVEQSVEDFRKAVAHDTPEHDYTRLAPSQDDSRVHAYCMLALALWSQGDPRQSAEAMERSFQIVGESKQPYARVWALYQRSVLCHMRGDLEAVSRHAGQLLSIATEKGFSFFVPLANFYLSTLAENPDVRLQALKENHDLIVGAGARCSLTYKKTIIAEELIEHGRIEEAGAVLDEILEYMEAYGERLFQSEYWRLRAKVLAASGDEAASIEAVELLTRGVQGAMEMRNRPMALRGALALHQWSGQAGQGLSLLREITDSYHSEDDTGEFMLAMNILKRDNPGS